MMTNAQDDALQNTDVDLTSARRVMSGMRPTGKLHLGHYVGVLENWKHIQGDYECFFSIVDWHSLTTKFDQTDQLKDHIYSLALDWLAAGVDPGQATIFVQSQVPEIAELHLLLGMMTPNKWVETDPTLKDMVQLLKEDLTYGLLGYPILQSADIMSVKGNLVPVGKDQLAHLEITRDIVRRFNHVYGTELFPSPKPLLTENPLLPGLDGRKMSKSYDNCIYLSDTADETFKKIKRGITDPARVKKTDPGEPENCQVIFQYYKVFANNEAQAFAAEECRTAARGCMDCKKILAEMINEQLRPLREKRTELEQDMGYVTSILKLGSERARSECAATLAEVREAMKLLTL